MYFMLIVDEDTEQADDATNARLIIDQGFICFYAYRESLFSYEAFHLRFQLSVYYAKSAVFTQVIRIRQTEVKLFLCTEGAV